MLLLYLYTPLVPALLHVLLPTAQYRLMGRVVTCNRLAFVSDHNDLSNTTTFDQPPYHSLHPSSQPATHCQYMMWVAHSLYGSVAATCATVLAISATCAISSMACHSWSRWILMVHQGRCDVTSACWTVKRFVHSSVMDNYGRWWCDKGAVQYVCVWGGRGCK